MEEEKDQQFVIPLHDSAGKVSKSASQNEQALTPLAKRRHATIYDAVAGKVSYNQGLQGNERNPQPQSPNSIKYSTKETPLAPDEVLFRRQGAPTRYLEHDIYYANERDLPRAGQDILPESDLLKAIHGYASAFYSAKSRYRQPPGNANVAERSMDETALLALGILLEEAGKEVLGRSGDLVFTEGADDAPASDNGGDEGAGDDDAGVIGHQDVTVRRGAKRRKLTGTDDE